MPSVSRMDQMINCSAATDQQVLTVEQLSGALVHVFFLIHLSNICNAIPPMYRKPNAGKGKNAVWCRKSLKISNVSIVRNACSTCLRGFG